MSNLLLITGAGASHDVVPKEVPCDLSYKPPLTKNLFLYQRSPTTATHKPYTLECLKNHPLAYQAGYEFYMRGDGESQSLEKYLTNLKQMGVHHSQANDLFWAIPLYLFDLFNAIGQRYLPGLAGNPSNYYSLLQRINGSRFKNILWINLNYDILADSAIKQITRATLDDFNEYMALHTPDNQLQIKYTKPHGSIDWLRQIPEHIDTNGMRTIGADSHFEQMLSIELIKASVSYGNLVNPRRGYYPAVTAPLGKYVPVYNNHIDIITRDLKTTESILCIGFGALDIDVLDLIKNNMPQVKEIKIVNGNNGTGSVALRRIIDHCDNVKGTQEEYSVFKGGFSDFIKNGVTSWLRGGA